MTDSTSHPITSLPDLSDEQVSEWLINEEYPLEFSEHAVITITASRLRNVARQSAQWGADQELEACCDWLDRNNQWAKVDLDELRDGRRPKPPSKIEIAEKLIARYSDGWTPSPNDWVIIRDALAEGRRAQEALSSD